MVSLHSEVAEGVVSGAFHLLLGDALLDEVLGRVYGVRVAGYRDDAVSGSRRKNSFLRYLDVGAAHLLDFYQRTTAWS